MAASLLGTNSTTYMDTLIAARRTADRCPRIEPTPPSASAQSARRTCLTGRPGTVTESGESSQRVYQCLLFRVIYDVILYGYIRQPDNIRHGVMTYAYDRRTVRSRRLADAWSQAWVRYQAFRPRRRPARVAMRRRAQCSASAGEGS